MEKITLSEITEAKEFVFVCSGNIIRSAFAELIAKNLIENRNFTSCGTEYFNNDIISETRQALLDKGIPLNLINDFRPTHITRTKEYDLSSTIFFGMTHKHVREIRSYFGEESKIGLLRNLIDENEEVEDPYFTNNFDKVFTKIFDCIHQLEKYLNN